MQKSLIFLYRGKVLLRNLAIVCLASVLVNYSYAGEKLVYQSSFVCGNNILKFKKKSISSFIYSLSIHLLNSKFGKMFSVQLLNTSIQNFNGNLWKRIVPCEYLQKTDRSKILPKISCSIYPCKDKKISALFILQVWKIAFCSPLFKQIELSPCLFGMYESIVSFLFSYYPLKL